MAHALLIVAAVAFGCGAGFIATPFMIEKLWALHIYDWPLSILEVAALVALIAVALPVERTGRVMPLALALAAGAMVGNCVGFASMQ